MAKQILVFYPHHRQYGAGSGATPLIDVERRPARLWTLPRERDPEKPPVLPIVPRHGHNAFSEDPGHDWSWRNSRLRFTGSSTTPVWLLLEYDDA